MPTHLFAHAAPLPRIPLLGSHEIVAIAMDLSVSYYGKSGLHVIFSDGAETTGACWGIRVRDAGDCANVHRRSFRPRVTVGGGGFAAGLASLLG